MAIVQDAGASAVGIGAGVGTTLLIRDQFDNTGETTVLRPSVLWGVGSGAGALLASLIMGDSLNMAGLPLGEFTEDYGEAALAAGAFSALSPKGSSSIQLPTI